MVVARALLLVLAAMAAMGDSIILAGELQEQKKLHINILCHVESSAASCQCCQDGVRVRTWPGVYSTLHTHIAYILLTQYIYALISGSYKNIIGHIIITDMHTFSRR